MTPLWWSHREHRCLRGWLVRRKVRKIRLHLRTTWALRKAWCQNCRQHLARPDGFCSDTCREDWQIASVY